MESWARLAVAVAVPSAAIFAVIVAAVCLYRCSHGKPPDTDACLQGSTTRTAKGCMCFYSPDSAECRFHHLDRYRGHKPGVCLPHHRGSDFSWDEHPGLVEEAVEGGWSRFAFVGRSDSLPLSKSLLGTCVSCDGGCTRAGPEVSWEVPMGSSEYLQSVRLDPGEGNIPLDGKRPFCSAMMSLPLPGPPLTAESPSFPPEAYFEITVMHFKRLPKLRQLPKWRSKRAKDDSSECDRIKLIHIDDPSNAVFSSYGAQELEAKILAVEKNSRKEASDAIMWVGLKKGGSAADRTPGSHAGSIGFSSNGSVHLDGLILVPESESGHWGAVNKVVGCGFDPGRKTVFFTVDSMLMHVVHCRSEAFGGPLYPALAADTDAMVTVNLGQCAFRYPPANAQRTTNPCFLRPSASAHIRYDDSRELFSMGRIDSQWKEMAHSKKTRELYGSSGSIIGIAATDGPEEGKDRLESRGGGVFVDIDHDADLFDISLDN